MLHHLKNTITWKSELLISKNGLHSPKLNPDLLHLMDFARRRFSRFNRFRLIKWAASLVIAGSLAALLGTAAVFAWFSRDLPSPDRVVRREGFSTQILARDGQSLYDVYSDVQREPVNFADVPLSLKQATVSVEDKNFYSHQGFDPLGMVRAVFNTAIRRQLQGGSTLTQQLVKNVLLTSERTLPRKIKEFVLAVQIEKKFSKDQILQMYLQEAPYGGATVGVETAAKSYFGKPVKDLNLVESAFLAGMPQAPSRYSPYSSINPDAYVGRTQHVLKRMREDGYISRDQEEEAVNQISQMKFNPKGQSLKAPHFVMYVKDLLVQQFGEAAIEGGGLKVTTTLDFPLQEKAQSIVAEEIEKVQNLHITNGAALVENPNNGEILAMVGSRDFFAEDIDGQVNVVLSKRQPGSAIKPVTYVAAFRQGYSPSTMLVDAKTSFDSGDPDKPYEPENYDGKFRGPVQLRYALGSSLNVPSVKLLQLIGLKNMLTLANEMGLTTLEPSSANMKRFGLSVTLGGGEVRLLDLVSAYGALGNGGAKIEPVAILKIENRAGDTIFEHHQTKGKQVLSPQEAFLISHILSDNNARLLTFGVNSLLNMGSRPVAVKTGTTNDKRDNWAIGWSRSAIVGAWVGNNDNSEMKQVASGVSGASPIWRRVMLEALNSYPSENFTPPAGVVTKEVDIISGYAVHDSWPSRPEYFIEGAVPDGPDPIHTKLTVCKNNGKLAGPVEIAVSDIEDREFIILKSPLSLPETDQKRWQEGIDAWISTQSDSRYHPPTENCDGGDDLIVKAKSPSDKTRINNNDFDWEVEIISDKKPDKVEIFVNGQSRQTLTSPPWKSTLHLDNGTYTLKFKARVEGGQEAETGDIKIGINQDWDAVPTPTPTPTPTPKL